MAFKIDTSSQGEAKKFTFNPDYAWHEYAENLRSWLFNDVFWFSCDYPRNMTSSDDTIFNGRKLKKDIVEIHKLMKDDDLCKTHPCYISTKLLELVLNQVTEDGKKSYRQFNPKGLQYRKLWKHQLDLNDWEYIDIPVYDIVENYSDEDKDAYDQLNDEVEERIQAKQQEYEDKLNEYYDAESERWSLELEYNQYCYDLNDLSGIYNRVGGPGKWFELFGERQDNIPVMPMEVWVYQGEVYYSSGVVSKTSYFLYKQNGQLEYIEWDQSDLAAQQEFLNEKEEQWQEFVAFVPTFKAKEQECERLLEEADEINDEILLLNESKTPTRQISTWRLWNTCFGKAMSFNRLNARVPSWSMSQDEAPMVSLNGMFGSSGNEEGTFIDLYSQISSYIPNNMWSISSIPFKWITGRTPTSGTQFIDGVVNDINGFFGFGSYRSYGLRDITIIPQTPYKPSSIEDMLLEYFKDTSLQHYYWVLASGMGMKQFGWSDSEQYEEGFGGIRDWEKYEWINPLTQSDNSFCPPPRMLYSNILSLTYLMYLNYRNWHQSAEYESDKFQVSAGRFATTSLWHPVVHYYDTSYSKMWQISIGISSSLPEGKKPEDYGYEPTGEEEAIWYYKFYVNTTNEVPLDDELDESDMTISYNEFVNARKLSYLDGGNIKIDLPVSNRTLTIGNFLGRYGYVFEYDEETNTISYKLDEKVEGITDEQYAEIEEKLSELFSTLSAEAKLDDAIEELQLKIFEIEVTIGMYNNQIDALFESYNESVSMSEYIAQQMADTLYQIEHYLEYEKKEDFETFELSYLSNINPELCEEVRDLKAEIKEFEDNFEQHYNERRTQVYTIAIWQPAYDYIHDGYGFISLASSAEDRMNEVEALFYADESISQEAKDAYTTYKQGLVDDAPTESEIRQDVQHQLDVLTMELQGYSWDETSHSFIQDPTTIGARWNALKEQYEPTLKSIYIDLDSELNELNQHLEELQDEYDEQIATAESYQKMIDEVGQKLTDLYNQKYELEEEIRRLREEGSYDTDWLTEDIFCCEYFTDITTTGQSLDDYNYDQSTEIGYSLEYQYPIWFLSTYEDAKTQGLPSEILDELYYNRKWWVDSDFPSRKFKNMCQINDNWMWKKYLVEENIRNDEED